MPNRIHNTTKMCSRCYDYSGKCNHTDFKFEVDDKLLDIIQQLNLKGYKTMGCCEGNHLINEFSQNKKFITYHETFDGYVRLDKDYNITIPKDSILIINKEKNNSTYISCDMTKIHNDKDIQTKFIYELKVLVNSLEEIS